MDEAAPTIKVDEQGFDENGFDYVWEASPDALAQGLVTSRDVILKYPDGHEEPGIEVLITKKGFARLSAEMPTAAAIGKPIGTA